MGDTFKWLSHMKTNASFENLYICVCIHENPCNNHACIFAQKSHIYVFRYTRVLFCLIIFVNMSILEYEFLEKVKPRRCLCMRLIVILVFITVLSMPIFKNVSQVGVFFCFVLFDRFHRNMWHRCKDLV